MPSLRGLTLDLRYALRVLARSPGFTTVAVVSLAIGIGANTAIFSVVHGVLLDPLPIDRPDELTAVYWSRPTNNLRFQQINSSGWRDAGGRPFNSNYTYGQYEALRRAAAGSADVAAFNFISQLNIAIADQPALAGTGLLVSDNFFQVLGLRMARGRPIERRDLQPGAAAVAVISHAFWVRAFGGDPAVLDQHIRIGGEPVRIVGITPAGFRGLSTSRSYPPTDVTLPLIMQPLVSPRWTPAGGSLFSVDDRYWLRLFARVPRDVPRTPVEQILTATERLQLSAAGTLTAEEAQRLAVALVPAPRGVDSLRSDLERPLSILRGVVAAVLLIACVNLAGLLLARGVARQRETSIRRALGASRGRLVRGLLVEGVVLAGAGGAAGLLLAVWSGSLVSSMLSTGLGTVDVPIGLDGRLLGAAAGVSGVAVLLFALLPAMRSTRGETGQAWKHRTLGGTAPRLTFGRALIALQIAITVPLVVGAGLFLRTVHNLGAVPLGFNPSGLMLFVVDASLSQTGPEGPRRIYGALVDRLESVPGVTSATLVENALVSGSRSSTTVTVNGQQSNMFLNAIGPRFFETMGIPVLAGRAIGRQDDAAAPRAVVLNRTAADKYFGGAMPVGQHFKVGPRDVEVVGVVADSKYDDLKVDVQATFYDSYAQREGLRGLRIVLRTAGDPAALVPAVRRAVAEVDRHLPITDVKTQADQIDETYGKEHILMRLLAVFGGVAILLAGIGLHGATAYSVARRTSEIGIRMALGAGRAQMLWLILGQVLILAAIGLAIGLPGALLAGPLVRSLLFGLAPADPATMTGAAIAVLAVSAAAGFLPARRAARMDPLHALKQE